MRTVRSLPYGGFFCTEDPLDREETPGQRPSFTENPLWTETHPPVNKMTHKCKNITFRNCVASLNKWKQTSCNQLLTIMMHCEIQREAPGTWPPSRSNFFHFHFLAKILPRNRFLSQIQGLARLGLGCTCFPEFYAECQILWSLGLAVFHALTLKLPIQTSLFVVPKLPVSLYSGEKCENFSKRSTPQGCARFAGLCANSCAPWLLFS